MSGRKAQELQSMLAQATKSLSLLREEQRASEALRAVEARRQEELADERRAADSRHFRELMERELREQANHFQQLVSNLEAVRSRTPSPVESARVPVPSDQEGQVQPVEQEPPSVTTMDVGARASEWTPDHGEPHQWDYLSVGIDAVSEIKERLGALDPREPVSYEDFRSVSREFRRHMLEAGRAGCKPPNPGVTWAKRHKVVVTGPLQELSTVAGPDPCARCSRDSNCRLWSCRTVCKDSGKRERAYLPLCKFCTASTWSGAWEDFPAVRAPPPSQPDGSSGERGGEAGLTTPSGSDTPNGSSLCDDRPGGGGGPGGDDPDDEDPGGGDRPSGSEPLWPPGVRLRSDYEGRMRKEESMAQRDALKLVKETVDPYGKAESGTPHAFSRLLRLMRQVEQLKRQQPVSYAMGLQRVVAIGQEVGLREGDPVLTEHSLLTEVVRHCFDTSSSEYLELRGTLQESEGDQSLTLEKIVVPLAKLVVPERSQMLAHDVVTMLSNHNLTSPVAPSEIFDIFLSGLTSEIMRQGKPAPVYVASPLSLRAPPGLGIECCGKQDNVGQTQLEAGHRF
eukprot:gene2927-3741_t